MFFSSAVPMHKVSTLIPCNNTLKLYNYFSATPVVGVSLSACNDLYHFLFTKYLTSLSLMQCCKVNNNNNDDKSPIFTPRKMRMHMNLDHVVSGRFVLGRDTHCDCSSIIV